MKCLIITVLLFGISNAQTIRLGTGKISINDMEKRQYFEENRIKVDAKKALCFRSIGPIGYYNEKRSNKGDKKVQEWKATKLLERIELKAVVNETSPLCKSKALDMFFKYKFRDAKTFDHVDVWVKSFQANLLLNQPQSCDEKKFIAFFEQLNQVRSQEYIKEKQSTVYECHPIMKSEDLRVEEGEFGKLKTSISRKMQEFKVSRLLNNEVLDNEVDDYHNEL